MKVEAGKYALLIVIQSVLYGIVDIVSKRIYQDISVYLFLLLRYILATLIMLCLWNKQILKDIKSTPLRKYVVPGVCMSLAFIVSNLALRFTAATNMSFIRSLSALIVPLLSLVFYKQKYAKKEPILHCLILIGLYLLCSKGGLNRFGLGEVLSLLSATLIASSLVFGKSSLTYVSSKTLSFVQTLFSMVFCGCMTVIAHGYKDVGSAMQPDIIPLIFAAAGFTIAGYMLQNIALLHISAKQVGVVQCLYPIVTAVIAFFVFDEQLSLLGIAGAIIISICVMLENLLPE